MRLKMALAAIALVVIEAGSATPPPSMEARNEAVIRKHHQLINRGEIEAAAALYADKILNNGHIIDRARITAVMWDNSRTFPDWNMHIDRLVAKGETVVALITVSGTHEGMSQRPVNGGMYLNVPPTEKHFSVLHTHWFRLKNGQIIEHLATRDDLSMSRQLGLAPPASPRPPDQSEK